LGAGGAVRACERVDPTRRRAMTRGPNVSRRREHWSINVFISSSSFFFSFLFSSFLLFLLGHFVVVAEFRVIRMAVAGGRTRGEAEAVAATRRFRFLAAAPLRLNTST